MSVAEELALEFEIVQRARIRAKHGGTFDSALRARDRWDDRWRSAFEPTLPEPRDWRPVARAAVANVEKARAPKLLEAVAGAVRAQIGSARDFAKGAMAVYMSLAHDESEDAGQHSLDQLGLNKTFRWTGVRDMPRDLFAVRGSKVIQNLYGNHVDALRDMVVSATDPAHPKSSADLTRDIIERWPLLRKRQAERIARTETAAVWNTTTLNAMIANEVGWFDVSVAKGPAVAESPVCPTCLLIAARGPYVPQEVPTLPVHPFCRCAYVPALGKDWLPPAEPWAGNDPPLPVYPAREP